MKVQRHCHECDDEAISISLEKIAIAAFPVVTPNDVKNVEF